MGAKDGGAKIGDVIDGRYRLLGVLGQGGMGRVFRAEHVGIRREVAIKLLHHELRANRGVQERVLREAFAMGRLEHPNCVAISDSGTLEGGGLYLVMELLKGETLGDQLDDRVRLSVRKSLLIAREILKGLAHAHSVGVVHRDLKPDNIFLVKSNSGNPVVKLLDFGIAKLLGAAKVEAGGADLTGAGVALGSPTYMSPEQACGGEIDGRSDLYSLTLILYEMMTGVPPFYEPDDRAKALQRRLREKAPVLRLSTASKETLPLGLQALVRTGLAANVDERVSSAKEYLRRLDVICAAATPPIGTQEVLQASNDASSSAGEPKEEAGFLGISTKKGRMLRNGALVGLLLAFVLGAVWIAKNS